VVLAEGGTLPSGFTPVRTDIPHVTNLRGLREVLNLAHARSGIQSGIISPGRAIVAASQYAAANHYDEKSFSDRLSFELSRCRRKIGIRPFASTITMTSIDSVARSPTRPPWAIYPLAPEVAASLIADTMFFFVSMSPDAIIDRLSNVGVQGEWMQPLDGNENWSEPLLRVAATTGNRLWFTSLNPEAIAALMLEFIDLRAWCNKIALMLSGYVNVGTRPWPYFANEHKTWC